MRYLYLVHIPWEMESMTHVSLVPLTDLGHSALLIPQLLKILQ